MKRNCTRNSGRFAGLAAVTLAAGLTLSATGGTFHVDGATGDDTNDGLFWSTPFKTIRKALDVVEANNDDVIWVTAGTYYPDEINGGDSDDRDDSFDLVDGVSVYGGFLNGDDFDDRDPENNITILSGDIDQDDSLDDDNSYHVVTAEEVGATTVLNGFTITLGNANDTFFIEIQGGGMQIIDANPIVARCNFSETFAVYGAGVGLTVTEGRKRG